MSVVWTTRHVGQRTQKQTFSQVSALHCRYASDAWTLIPYWGVPPSPLYCPLIETFGPSYTKTRFDDDANVAALANHWAPNVQMTALNSVQLINSLSPLSLQQQ